MEISHCLSEKAKKDLVLVEEARRGNEKAYSSLMNNYKDSMYLMLLKMVNNRTVAEDLTIEAFGKAFDNIDTYTPSYAFSTWLFSIATNNCIDFIRKVHSNPISIDNHPYQPDALTIIQSDLPDPEERLINQQRIISVRDIIKQLKPKYRTLIELRYLKDYSYEEIASELDIPIGTVKTRLHRAKSMLFNISVKKGLQ